MFIVFIYMYGVTNGGFVQVNITNWNLSFTFVSDITMQTKLIIINLHCTIMLSLHTSHNNVTLKRLILYIY